MGGAVVDTMCLEVSVHRAGRGGAVHEGALQQVHRGKTLLSRVIQHAAPEAMVMTRDLSERVSEGHRALACVPGQPPQLDLSNLPFHARNDPQEVSLAAKLFPEGGEGKKRRDLTAQKGKEGQEKGPGVAVSAALLIRHGGGVELI